MKVARRGGRIRLGKTEIVLAIALVATACSSVPDIVFDDGGAAGAGAGADADVDATSGTDGGTKDASTPDVYVVSCPSSPPIGGVCCGNLPCYGCPQTDCTGCAALGCPFAEVCCKKGPNLRCEPEKVCR